MHERLTHSLGAMKSDLETYSAQGIVSIRIRLHEKYLGQIDNRMLRKGAKEIITWISTRLSDDIFTADCPLLSFHFPSVAGSQERESYAHI